MSNKLKDPGKLPTNPGWLCFVWFGMTAGISLLATSARFAAPTLLLQIPGFRSLATDRPQARNETC